ncbi:hypothetical protein CKO42_02985 [Lamprobacter modestohalophilus]|uniref:DUF4351 domain-containing protein n=1 Tax=Lamprobacter modestohalophilus TaxID=1064514 RepID=A0A9X0W5Y8_9GAMM|nr:hypothetical protein [Lamprobacter modestohalophilus]MBK1617437.1 hypothetical protein [Lamprobacter modestohalophilus]
MPSSHDQNFKNLIIDYPRQAIELFAPDEAEGLSAPGVRYLPVREEQLKERLGDRFRELDTPLLVEWPDRRREALLFLFEEETKTRRFSIHRLAHYCLDVAELLGTERIVPVVIFLRGGHYATELRLGSERRAYLAFACLAYAFRQQQARDHFGSPNLIARLNLPNMRHPRSERVAVYAEAVRGLLELEPDPERQLKYLDFVDIYAHLSEEERMIYQQEHAPEAAAISGFAERFLRQGEAIGEARGEARLLRQLLTKRFGEPSESIHQRLETADAETLALWFNRALEAQALEDIFCDEPTA